MFNFTEDMIPDLHMFLELYYYKILRVNLTTDTYEIILTRSNEPLSEDKSLTGWMREFAETHVAPEDKEEFLRHADIDFLRANTMGEYHFFFNRRTGPDVVESALILLPSKDYEDDNQVCIMFAKEIELAG